MRWTGGRAVFASGSPFPPLVWSPPSGPPRTVYPAQANNAYAFPSIGFAAVLTRCSRITDEVMTTSMTTA
eukprot:528794-Pyramimonas_sp.AAC.1